MPMSTHDHHSEASKNLAFIRETMESASSFTAVSGLGTVAVGCVGLLAAWIAWPYGTETPLGVWIPAAFLALASAGIGNWVKAKRLDVPMWTGSFRKMAWGIVPALLAGGALTLVLTREGASHLLPGTWLSLYGAGVAAAGTFSVRALRWMGLVFLGLGVLALFRPDWGLVLLAVGFGGVHIVSGIFIARSHGG